MSELREVTSQCLLIKKLYARYQLANLLPAFCSEGNCRFYLDFLAIISCFVKLSREMAEEATILNNVVLHDVTTGRILMPNVQFVYQGEEVAPQVLQRAWLTVQLQNDGSVLQINSTHPDARVNDFHISNDEATGETLHVEGLFPFEYSLLPSRC
jgi:hypothetical protein